MSGRDVTRMLNREKEELSSISSELKSNLNSIGELTSQLQEAEKVVTKINDELVNTNNFIRLQTERVTTLTVRTMEMMKFLLKQNELSEKEAYVNKCIEFLVLDGDYYSEYVYKHCDNFPEDFDGFTEKFLEDYSDDNIIKMAHIVRTSQIFHDFRELNYTKALCEWDFNESFYENPRSIFFSNLTDCEGDEWSPDSCCHKKYDTILNWTYNDMISYTCKYGKPFRIDTLSDEAYGESKVD